MKKQTGFTLIELVIVVVILGFLAVTAIPKFIDLTDKAKQANIEGMAGGFATGVSLVRSQWEAEGRPENASNLNAVNYDGNLVILTTENNTTSPTIRPGYIVSSVNGQNNGAALGGGFTALNCVDIWQSIFQQPPTITSSLATLNGAGGDAINYFATKSGTSQTTMCHYYLKETLTKDNGTGNYNDPASSTSVGNSFTYLPATSEVVVHINNN